jgi:molecular chaperone DnaK
MVARGAALYAALRSEHNYLDADSQFEVVNVNAHSLGIHTVDLETKQRVNKIIIPRNTPLPTSSTQVFPTTEDGQKNARVQLLEGESENPVFCTALGQCVVHLDRAMPKGTLIRVCCSYDANGTISVTAQVPATKASATVELRREGFAELEPLAVWRKRLSTADTGHETDPGGHLPAAPAALGPDSDVNELLVRLDQLYAHVGCEVAEAAVPTSAVPTQRLLKQTKGEAAALKRLIDLLNKKQDQQKVPSDRMQMQGHLARARMAWDQSNRLYLHSCIDLGRMYLRDRRHHAEFASVSEEATQLQRWLDSRMSS